MLSARRPPGLVLTAGNSTGAPSGKRASTRRYCSPIAASSSLSIGTSASRRILWFV